MNFNMFAAINGLAARNHVLDKIMIFFSTGVPLIFMVLLAGLYLYGAVRKNKKYRQIAIDSVAVTGINLIISYFIGLVFFIPRPFVHHKVKLLVPHVADASFPSDHSIGTMSIALGINNGLKLYGRIMIVLSCLVGFSRVFVGNHYPFDVLGAFGIAILMNYIYKLVINNKLSKLYFFIEAKFLTLIPAYK